MTYRGPGVPLPSNPWYGDMPDPGDTGVGDYSGGGGNASDVADRIASRLRRRTRLALQPRSFTAKREDGGVLFRIIDRDPIAEGTGATRYDIYWAQDVDLSTAATVAAGFARATLVLSISAPGGEGRPATGSLFGARYLRGFYYCVGVGLNPGDQSEPTPPIAMNDSSVGDGYPEDVQHFAATESGEVHNGVPYSVISFVYQAPNDDRFLGVKFFVKDYPVINEIYQTHFHRHTGQRGGTGQDKFKWEIGRRKGTGDLTIALDVVTGTSSAFLAEMNTGDLIEARGYTEEVLSVTNNTSALLAAWWGGDSVTTLSDWWVIPEVTIYAVSIGKDGSHRDDIENAPSVTLYLDGRLSAPVAPVLVGNKDANGISTLGEINRLEFDQLDGTEIKAYHLFRGKGAGVAFSSCAPLLTVTHDPHVLASGHHAIDDKDFTVTEKEQRQVWSYYLVAENWREQRSSPSSRVEIACRLTHAGGVDPSVPARSGILNLLYNAAFSGTAGNNVAAADVSQDAFNNVGGPPAGWARWNGTVGGVGATIPTHALNDQVHFVAPTATGEAFCYQDINAWDIAGVSVLTPGALLTFQALLKHGGVLPNGSFWMYLESYNGAVFNEYCPRRYRDPADDALKWYAPGDSRVEVSMADLDDEWRMFYAIFQPRIAPVVTTILRVTFGWSVGTVGELHVTQPMLSFGEELCNWTGQMVDTNLRPPYGTDPYDGAGDGWGHRDQILTP